MKYIGRSTNMAVNLDDEMEDLSLGQLGSAGGIGTSSASRARMLAIEREKQMKKRSNSAQQGMSFQLFPFKFIAS